MGMRIDKSRCYNFISSINDFFSKMNRDFGIHFIKDSRTESTGTWAGSTWTLTLDGAMTDGVHAVHLDALSASSVVCAGQASGTVSLRDPGGYWYALPIDCGCGQVRYAATTDLGEACVDLSAVLDDLASEMRP